MEFVIVVVVVVVSEWLPAARFGSSNDCRDRFEFPSEKERVLLTATNGAGMSSCVSLASAETIGGLVGLLLADFDYQWRLG